MTTHEWTVQMSSHSRTGQTYTVKCRRGVYSCSCPAWRIQRIPITRRTCKHLIELRGTEAEKHRAPESFSGLTRVHVGPVAQPVAFMSFQTWKPCLRPPARLQGWLYSVKLDGAFGRWADGVLRTKGGRELHPPVRLTRTLPREVALDGEIYHPDRQKVRKAVLADEWDEDVEFVVFDLVDATLPFTTRYQRLQAHHARHAFQMVRQRVFSAPDWPALETQVRQQGEEGLVLRDPAGQYEAGRRVHTTLKWKPWVKGAARVEAWQPKKVGGTLTLREVHGAPSGHRTSSRTFRVYTRQHSALFPVGRTVQFMYAGRDEDDGPEFAQLAAAGTTNCFPSETS